MAGQQSGDPGPFRVGPKILLCLVPLLSLGLLGLVPSLVLALRRRRVADLVGAAVFGLLQLGLYVSIGLTEEKNSEYVLSSAGSIALMLLWLAAPVHFLIADARGQARRAVPQPAAAWYPPPQYPAAPPSLPPAVAPAPAQDELQQLGELLRRQSQDGKQ